MHRKVKKELAVEIADKLLKKRIKLFYDPITAEKINVEKTEVKDMRIDLAVIVGGDGTILWAINELPDNPPILGIKTGRVGYLAELNPENITGKLDLLFKGKFYLDNRMKLKIDDEFEVLNEVLVLSRQASLLEFRIYLDGTEITKFRADGVMISTPTGSTGHSMSAGGPALHPKVKAYVITPMNPFLREQFPLVVPGESKTEVEIIREDRDAQIVLDGQLIKEIKPHQKISIKKAENTIKFIRFSKNFSCDHIKIKRRG